MPTDRELLDELVVATEALLSACNIAANVLSEEYETLITGPAGVVESVIAKCPAPESFWDGTLRQEDVETEVYRAEFQNINEEMRGVKMTHRITGISATAYAAPSQQQNKDTAWKALRKMVKKQYDERGV